MGSELLTAQQRARTAWSDQARANSPRAGESVTGRRNPMREWNRPCLSILIVSYNTRDMTLACLQSIAEQTHDMGAEIIVVDNASNDGSADAIDALSLRLPLKLIRLDENVGFARGNNIAAQSAGGRHLLLLNPDTIVQDRAIDRLHAFARTHPTAGIYGGRTVFADGTLNASCCWQRMTLWNCLCRATGLTGLAPNSALFNAEAYGGWQRNEVRNVDIVSGCFLMIRRELWDVLGGFDPSYFMYGEEADLCLRARSFRARPLFTPTAQIVHYGGASETSRSAKTIKLLAAKATLIRKHWSPLTAPLGVALLQAWPLTRWLSLSAASRLFNRPTLAAKAKVWREALAATGRWSSGYEAASPNTSQSPTFSATVNTTDMNPSASPAT